jgi:hypothetical protein
MPLTTASALGIGAPACSRAVPAATAFPAGIRVMPRHTMNIKSIKRRIVGVSCCLFFIVGINTTIGSISSVLPYIKLIINNIFADSVCVFIHGHYLLK